MSAATTVPTASSSTLPRWLRLAGWYTLGHGYLIGGVLAAGLVVAVGVLLVLGLRGVTVTMSVVQIGQQIVHWVAFGVAIHFAINWLPVQLAAGLTRRSYLRATVLSAVLVGLASAVLVGALFVLERWVYGLLGWTPGVDGRAMSGVVPSGGLLVSLALVVAVAVLSGALVGLSFLSLGPWGMVLLPLTLSPILLASAVALETGSGPVTIIVDGAPWRLLELPLWGGVVAWLLIAVGAALALHLAVRRMPVHGPRA